MVENSAPPLQALLLTPLPPDALAHKGTAAALCPRLLLLLLPLPAPQNAPPEGLAAVANAALRDRSKAPPGDILPPPRLWCTDDVESRDENRPRWAVAVRPAVDKDDAPPAAAVTNPNA